MKVIRVKKYQSKINRKAPKKPPIHLRRNDWEALMQHDRLTGKLDLRSKEVIRDPGSVKRLLEAEMIDPHGKLTHKAREKCAVLAEKLQNLGLPGSAAQQLSAENKPVVQPGKKVGNIIPAHWAVLMKYDRKTGNLLKIDPQTGRLNKTSRLILKNPLIIQRLVEKNLILPGGWLTPEAKKGCIRLEQRINARAAKENTEPRASIKRKIKDDPDPGTKSKDRSNLKPRPKNRPKPATLSTRMAGSDGDMQMFFEGLQQDATVGGAEFEKDSEYDFQDQQDWQRFFENLPDDTFGVTDPGIFFTYDWKDQRDLQAYFENLPQYLPGSGAIARSNRKTAKK